MTFIVCISHRSDSEVYEKDDRRLCDTYLKWHASNHIHFWTYLQKFQKFK